MTPDRAWGPRHSTGCWTSFRSRISPRTPDIRFRQMNRARNLVAHNYDIISPQIVWNTLALALPDDVAKIRRLLER